MVKNIRPISNNYIYLSLHVGVVILSSLSFLEVMHDIKFGSMEVGGRTTENREKTNEMTIKTTKTEKGQEIMMDGRWMIGTISSCVRYSLRSRCRWIRIGHSISLNMSYSMAVEPHKNV